MRHNLIIECAPMTSEELMSFWEGLIEGVCESNCEYFLANPDSILSQNDLPAYELPRPAGNTADQRVATAPVINARKRATCVEWCAYIVGVLRAKGENDAIVKLIPIFSKRYSRPVDYSYHAVVQRQNGEIYDYTLDLPGYNGTGEWWRDAGHCCPDCALGIGGAQTVCLPCSQGAR